MEYARRLDVRNVPLRQFGIQFIQIGDDGDAAEALKELDANLGSERGIRVRSYDLSFLMKLILYYLRNWWTQPFSVPTNHSSTQT
jgi:hypothetical protein